LLIGVTLLVLTYVLPFELSGAWLVAAWLAVFLSAIVVQRAQESPDAPRVPALDATTITWLRYFGFDAVAMLAGALAVGHLFAVEVTQTAFDSLSRPNPPFSDDSALVAAMIVASMVAGAIVSRHPLIHRGALLTTVGVAFAIVPFEVSAPTAVVLWSALGLAPLFFDWRDDDIWMPYAAVAGFIGVATWALVLGTVAPVDQMLDALPRGDERLLLSGAGIALLALIGASATAAYSLRNDPAAKALAVSAFAAAAYLVRYEVGWVATVVGWSALAVLAVVIGARQATIRDVLRKVAVVLLAGGALVTFADIAPLDRLVIDETSSIDHSFLWSGATVALGALALALFALYRHVQTVKHGWVALALSGGCVVYLLSVAVVDHFQGQVGGSVDLETLERRSQVALSILWAVLGGAAFAFGIMRRQRPARVLGLGLLGLATAKVFLFDLAFLNTSYRVLSFIGLGILLLASSYLYQRVIVQPAADDPEAPEEQSLDDGNDLKPATS
jgi:hypothetical protein